MIIAEFHPMPQGWRKFRKPEPKRRYFVEKQVGLRWEVAGNPKGYRTRDGARVDAAHQADWSVFPHRVVDRWLD